MRLQEICGKYKVQLTFSDGSKLDGYVSTKGVLQNEEQYFVEWSPTPFTEYSSNAGTFINPLQVVSVFILSSKA